VLVWKRLDHVGLVWKRLDHVGLVWKRLDHVVLVWKKLDHVGLVWKRLDHVVLVWKMLDHVGLVCEKEIMKIDHVATHGVELTASFRRASRGWSLLYSETCFRATETILPGLEPRTDISFGL
jgi:hypothetical protein